MKLQLSPSAITSIAALAGPYGSLEDSAKRVLNAFVAVSHDPFTRKDLCVVLTAMGGPKDPINDIIPGSGEPGVEGWRVLNPIYKACTPLERGFYSQKSVSPSETLVSEENEVPEVKVVMVTEVVVEQAPNLYDVDLGLRRQAAADTVCFGYHSPKFAVCLDCPLARFCKDATRAALSEVAHSLDMEFLAALENAKAKAAEKANPVYESPSVETVRPPRAPESPKPVSATLADIKVKFATATEVKLPFPGVCAKCDKPMDKESLAIHVQGHGMLHHVCAMAL